MSLPVIAAMWVRGAVRVFMPLMEDVDKERQKLIDKYADFDDNDQRIVDASGKVEMSPEAEDAFRDEVDQLLEIEHEVVCKPLQANMLQAQNPANEVLLVPAQIASLEDVGLIVVVEHEQK
jgi:hypothetical protein